MSQQTKEPYLLKSWQHAFYGMARAGGTLVNLVLLQWAMFYYVPPEGEGTILMPIGLFGAVILFGRLVDAGADPLVGFWSDRSKTRWGRRIPFIAFGSLPLVLAFVLLWFPPVQEYSIWNGVYFAFLAGIFFFLYTVVFCPHNALLAEVTANLKERVTLSTWGAFFGLIGAVVIAVAAAPLIEHFGYKVMGIMIGAIALFMLYGPVIAIKERSHAETDHVTFKFTEAVKYTFSNKPFMYYLLSNVFFQLGGNAVVIIAPYFVTQILQSPTGHVSYVMGAHLLAVVACFPFVTKLVGRYGKRSLFSGALLIFSLMLPLMYLIGRVDLPLPLLYQGMIMFFLAGIPMSVIYVVPNAIVADTIDYDQVITGKSRAAMYFGIQGVLHKTSVGISSVYVTFLFATFGNTIANPQGIYLVGPLGGLFVFIGYLIFRKYPKNDLIEEAKKMVA